MSANRQRKRSGFRFHQPGSLRCRFARPPWFHSWRYEMPFHTHTLANGLQILGETNPSALSVALGFFVRTGARDEVEGESGVTHFLEHMIFKGTERCSAVQVNKDFDRIGADNNAFTSEENTVFHPAILPEYLPEA